MAHLTAAAHRLFATQHGVAAVDQLIIAGHTARAIRRLESDRALALVIRQVYRSPSVALTELGRCAALCLALPHVTVAGPTAGRIWGFRRLPRDRRVHVISPPASNPCIATWVVPYRTAAIHCADIIERKDGIRVTSRSRTALDLTRVLSTPDLRSVIEQTMAEGGVSAGEMREVALDWMTRGRPWVRRFLETLDRRLPGGPAESHPEVRFAEALRDAGVHGLVRQFDIDLPGYGPARFDLAVPRLRLAIEIDVHPTHGETLGMQRDSARDASAATLGWRVHRVPRHRYLDEFDDEVARALTEYNATARPSNAMSEQPAEGATRSSRGGPGRVASAEGSRGAQA